MDTPHERVAAVVALKTLPAAKSRMSGLPGPLRERLARCMALDTVRALAAAVPEVVVISSQSDLGSALTRHGVAARVVAEPTEPATTGDDTLNEALAHGDRLLRSAGAQAVLACVGDLPALRPESVRQVIAAASHAQRGFLADHSGRGTTMLIARGVPLNPLYGRQIAAGADRDGGPDAGSAARHRASGAVPLFLGQASDARWDVDTLADLEVAWRNGLGPATRPLLDPASGALGRYLSVAVLGRGRGRLTILADQVPASVPLDAYDGDPAHLVPGRRLHAVRVADALRCWA